MCKLQNGSFRFSRCETSKLTALRVFRRLFLHTWPRPPAEITARVTTNFYVMWYFFWFCTMWFYVLLRLKRKLPRVIKYALYISQLQYAVPDRGWICLQETLVCDHSTESYWALLSTTKEHIHVLLISTSRVQEQIKQYALKSPSQSSTKWIVLA